MPTDAKCGLLVGVGVVLVVAVLYFRADPPAAPARAATKSRVPAAAVPPPQPAAERATRPPAAAPRTVNGEPGA